MSTVITILLSLALLCALVGTWLYYAGKKKSRKHTPKAGYPQPPRHYNCRCSIELEQSGLAPFLCSAERVDKSDLIITETSSGGIRIMPRED